MLKITVPSNLGVVTQGYEIIRRPAEALKLKLFIQRIFIRFNHNFNFALPPIKFLGE